MDQDKLRDILFRHAAAARGIGQGVADKIVRLLNASDADLVDQIVKRYARIEADGFDKGPATTRRLEDILEAIREVNSKAYSNAAAGLIDQLEAIAATEAEFAAKSVKKAGGKVDLRTTIPDANFLKTLVTVTPLPFSDDGHTLLMPWLEVQEAGRLRRLEGALRTGILQGQTTGQMVQRIRGTKANQFTDGVLQTSRKDAQTIALTANAAIQNAAREETWGRMKTIQYLEWSSILDSRTSQICQSRSGTIYRKDEPHPSPPAHPRCFPGSTLVTTGDGTTAINRVKGVSKRWFDGNLIVITTASGKRLTCTPNHPILTRSGFIPAGSIAVGDDVVSYRSSDGVGSANDEHKDVIAPISEIADAFLASSEVATGEVPLTAKDFHGDAIDGDIAIIGTYSKLGETAKPTLSKHFDQDLLTFSPVASFAAHSRPRDHAAFLQADDAPTAGFVRGFRKALSLFRGGASHAGKLLLTTVSNVDSGSLQTWLEGTRSESNHLANLRQADAALIKFDGTVDVGFDQSPSSGKDTGINEQLSSRLCIDPVLSSAILNGETGFVIFDQIREVGVEYFSGHVYNLETDKGYYQAEGLVVHNCRSLLIPRRDNEGTKHRPFGEWLRDQPQAVQEEVLGSTRAEVFRNNPSFDFNNFFNEQGGYKTLAELRKFNAKLFGEEA